ncbi:GntR family transcriptional regulator [Leifsonia aquatica]|uniref:Transcriptional regulator, GntR family n=2 Tax=Leifsonia aquatica TaxID=144185 RepID=U2R272_LEIAQ|nr:GntR family transcriptional regulator [Leifsonia aquatica]ERK69370.1 transcriptional regulator, GntR family [Leifsonia aquatica ATCC 14665]MBB2968944.1 DNA-binding GntR family transcriptional regulator [Leifsonia aquatica]
MLLRDIVRDQLRDAILDGTFAPGELLRDAELAEWLEISRTPLREAINDLARIGLIETSPNRYTRVATRKTSRIVPAMRTLAVLHGGAVLMAVPHLSAETSEELQRSCTHLAAAFRAGDAARVRDTFMPFFSAFADHTSNDVYRHLALDDLDGLYFQVPIEELVRALDASSARSLARAADELVDAIARADASAARDAAEAMHTRMVPAL